MINFFQKHLTYFTFFFVCLFAGGSFADTICLIAMVPISPSSSFHIQTGRDIEAALYPEKQKIDAYNLEDPTSRARKTFETLTALGKGAIFKTKFKIGDRVREVFFSLLMDKRIQ